MMLAKPAAGLRRGPPWRSAALCATRTKAGARKRIRPHAGNHVAGAAPQPGADRRRQRALAQAAAILAGASTVHVAGFRSSYPIAFGFHYLYRLLVFSVDSPSFFPSISAGMAWWEALVQQLLAQEGRGDQDPETGGRTAAPQRRPAVRRPRLRENRTRPPLPGAWPQPGMEPRPQADRSAARPGHVRAGTATGAATTGRPPATPAASYARRRARRIDAPLLAEQTFGADWRRGMAWRKSAADPRPGTGSAYARARPAARPARYGTNRPARQGRPTSAA